MSILPFQNYASLIHIDFPFAWGFPFCFNHNFPFFPFVPSPNLSLTNLDKEKYLNSFSSLLSKTWYPPGPVLLTFSRSGFPSSRLQSPGDEWHVSSEDTEKQSTSLGNNNGFSCFGIWLFLHQRLLRSSGPTKSHSESLSIYVCL